MNDIDHGQYQGVVDIARNGVDEVIRLRRLNAELVGALQWAVNWVRDDSVAPIPWVQAARAALAKVESKT